MNIFKKAYVAIQEAGVELPPSADRCLIERGVAVVRALIAENERIEEARRLEEAQRRAAAGEDDAGSPWKTGVRYKTHIVRQIPPELVVGNEKLQHRPPDLYAAVPTFSACLVRYVRDRCGGKAPIAYKRAGIDRKLYSRIVSDNGAAVSKQTAMQLAIGLQLNRQETDAFLKAAGFALSPTIPFDRVFAYCIEHEIWNILDVNGMLVACGLHDLGLNL